MKRLLFTILCLAFFIASSAGCGYRLISPGRRLPPDIRSVKVTVFENHTELQGLEIKLARALCEELSKYQRLELAHGQADAMLTGSIEEATSAPIYYLKGRFPQSITLKATIKAKLVRSSDGKVLWRSGQVNASKSFSVRSEVHETELHLSAAEDALCEAAAKTIADGILFGK